MRKIFYLLIIAFSFLSENAWAQMPNCTQNPSAIIYIQTGSSIYNYNVTLPVSATNPILNTISMPSGGGGLAVSNNLNGPGPSPTFYTSVSNNWWYYNGTTWVNTGHSCGNTAAVNSGGGGNYIYNLVGSSGQVYQYDGTGNSTLLLTVPGFSGGGPYDLVGDCDGGFYILRTNPATNPAFLRKYSSTGALVGSWTTTGSASNAGGGFAIVNNTVFYHNGSGFHSAPFTPPSSNLAFAPNPNTIPSPSDMACCRVCDSLFIPPPPPNADFGMSSDTICEGEFIALTDLSTDTPTVWNWQMPSGTPPSSNVQNPSNVYFNTPGTFAITLIVSNAGGSDTISKNIVVHPKPIASITGNTDICSGESTVLTASPASGVTYAWSSSGTSQSISVSPNVTTTYTVIVSNGNCLDTAQITVDVTAQPIANISGESEICFGESATLLATPANVIYQWSTNESSQSITTSPTSTTIYKVVVINGICMDSATHTVAVNPLPIVTASSTLTNCDANTGTATAVAGQGTPGFTYAWNGGLTGSTISDLPVGNYTVIVTDSKNCTTSTSVSVGMHPNPVAVIFPYPYGQVRIGESIKINASGGVKYQWTPSIYLDCDNCPEPTSTPKQEEVNYCVNVTDINGCEDTACTTIFVDTSCSYIFIPNAFSPNNDGLNDKISVNNTCDIDKLVFSIFNRYGQKVFESNDVRIKWDGTFNGEPQPVSTYYYYLQADLINGRKVRQRGDITLIR